MIEKVQTGLIWGFLILFLYFIGMGIWEIESSKDSIKTVKHDVEMKDSTLRTVKEWVNQNKMDKQDYQNQITNLQESLKKKNALKPIKTEIKSVQMERYEVMDAKVSPKVIVKDTVVYNTIYKDTLVWVMDTVKFKYVDEVETASKPKWFKKKNRKKNSAN